MFPETDHLVVLPNDLGSSLGEVEGEGSLIGPQVVDVEDEFFGEVFRGAPDDPADARVDEAVFVPGDVDGDDFLETEVPLEVGYNERSYEASAGSIHMDRAVDFLLDQEVVDGFDVLVLAGVGGADDGADTDRVLVDELDSFGGVDHVAVFGAVDVAFFDFEVAGGFFPADLHRRVHDDVGFGIVFAFGFALVLPAFLHASIPLYQPYHSS